MFHKKTVVYRLWSVVPFVDDVIVSIHCNGIIFVQERAQFGEITGGVFAGDPGLINGCDFDYETRRCGRQLLNKIHAQRLDIWIRNVMIKIKIKDIRRGNGRAGFEHRKEGAACPIQWLDGVAYFKILFKEACDLFGAVCGCGNRVTLNLAKKRLGWANTYKNSDEKDEGGKRKEVKSGEW